MRECAAETSDDRSRRRDGSAQRILVLGQTPPPVHGQSLALASLVGARWSDLPLRHLPMRFSREASSVGRFAPRKLVHLVAVAARAIFELASGRCDVLYYPPAPGRFIPVLRDVAILLCVRPFAKATVLHFHAGGVGSFARRHPRLAPLLRRAYGRADLAIEVGASAPRDGEALEARDVVIVPNGIAEPPPPGSVPRDARTLDLLFLGHHCAGKGLDTALEAVALARARGVPARLDAAGEWLDDRFRRDVLERLRRDDLAGAVTLHGGVEGDAKWRLIHRCDALLFPTRWAAETQGLVCVEAMACARPVLASDWSGPRDVVRHGETGWLLPADSPEAFADAIGRLWDDPGAGEQMGAAGRRRFEKEYRLDRHLERMHAVLGDVAASVRGAPRRSGEEPQ